MRSYIAATVVASAFVVTPVFSDEHPAHWQQVENTIQNIHEQIDQAVEAGDAQQIHEFVDQLEASFRNAVEMEQQHKDEDMHRRHQAIDDQTHEKHESIEQRRRIELLRKSIAVSMKNLSAGTRRSTATKHQPMMTHWCARI